VKKLIINKEYSKAVSFITTGALVLASILFVSYLVAPLFGGKFLVYAVIMYASWVGLFLVLKVFLQRSRKGLRIRAYEYLLGCLFSIVTPLVCFRNVIVIGVIVSMLVIVGFWFAYRADRVQEK